MFLAASAAAYFTTRFFYLAHVTARYTYLGTRYLGSLAIAQNKKMEIQPYDALDDNYMYLIIDKTTNEAAFVDPVNPQIIPDILKKNNAKLTTVLTTHHHWDHAGGNDQMKQNFPGVKVFGGDERVQGITDKVKDNDVIKVGNLEIRCFSTPCHTSGHICYYIDTADEKAVFTGDTLFLAGCGRFFEGTADQMNCNLNEILGNLPDQTNVYCGHEYTKKNLQFGLTIEPNNINIIQKLQKIEDMKKAGGKVRTVPGTIGEEKLTNVFMRVNESDVKKYVGKSDAVEVMAALRKLKDAF